MQYKKENDQKLTSKFENQDTFVSKYLYKHKLLNTHSFIYINDMLVS